MANTNIDDEPLLSTFALVYDSLIFQVWRLQAALCEQTEITNYSQQEFERLKNVIFSSFADGLLIKGHGLNV